MFRKFFGAVRAIFRLWGSFVAPDGDHPNFRQNALGVKRPLSELSETSGEKNATAIAKRYGNRAQKCLFFLGKKKGRKTVQILKNYGGSKITTDSGAVLFLSRNGVPRLEQYENRNSRSKSPSDSQN